jgi:poly-gamma-glutamate system protein
MLAVLCYGLYYWSENSHIKRKTEDYAEKIKAAELMEQSLRAYQEATAAKGVFDENYKDPRLDAIIGQQFSLITTEIGAFEAKVAGANPNVAAVAVDLLVRTGVRKGDYVAVAMTGSDPGVNTAVLCACEALGVTPVTITSIGSSWWGATDPDFTWADMETLLNREGIIHSKRVGASLGGINDNAVGLSQTGQDLMKVAIKRNSLTLIQENNLPAAIARRLEIYKAASGGKAYSAYVNVGDGVASLGDAENAALIHNGVNEHLPFQNYPARGLVHRFGADGVPIVHIANILDLSKRYGLGGAHVPLPAIGQGAVYIEDRYSLIVAGIAAVIALLAIVVLVRLDARLFKLADAGVDPDTLI